MSSPTESFSGSPKNRSLSPPGRSPVRSPSRNDRTFDVFSGLDFRPRQPRRARFQDVRNEVPSVLFHLTNKPAFSPSTLPSGLDNSSIDSAEIESYLNLSEFGAPDLNIFGHASSVTTDDRDLNPLPAASQAEDPVAPGALVDDFTGESVIHRSLDSPSSRFPDSALLSTTLATSQPQALPSNDFVSPSSQSQIVEDEQQLKLKSTTDCSQVEEKMANLWHVGQNTRWVEFRHLHVIDFF